MKRRHFIADAAAVATAAALPSLSSGLTFKGVPVVFDDDAPVNLIHDGSNFNAEFASSSWWQSSSFRGAMPDVEADELEQAWLDCLADDEDPPTLIWVQEETDDG